MLVLCNFFFCHYVFKSRLLQRRQKASIWGKGLNSLAIQKYFSIFFYIFSKLPVNILYEGNGWVENPNSLFSNFMTHYICVQQHKKLGIKDIKRKLQLTHCFQHFNISLKMIWLKSLGQGHKFITFSHKTVAELL